MAAHGVSSEETGGDLSKSSSRKRLAGAIALIAALGGIPGLVVLCNQVGMCGADDDAAPAPPDVNVVMVDATNEFIVVRNDSDREVSLAGWYVEDEARHRFDAFPVDFVLAPRATVTIHSGEGTPSDVDLYWGRKSEVWNNDGDTAFLYDHDDQLVDQASASTPDRSDPDQSIPSAVGALRAIFSPGRNRDVRVDASEPMAMVRQYVEIMYEDAHGFVFVENSHQFVADERTAGTMQAAAVVERLYRNLESLRRSSTPSVASASTPDVLEDETSGLVETLAASGAVFGFDGFNQSFCAAPTEMLLVLDRTQQMVHTVDIWPCLA